MAIRPPAQLSAVESVKADSDFLRGALAEELASPSTHITEAGYQLLKFHGSYQQDDRDLRNERRRAHEEYAFGFMVRLRLPGGDIHPDLWLALDRLADLGNGSLRLTTRQSVQLHGIPKHDLRTVIRSVNEHLASTLAACGDVNRNVVASPAPLDEPAYRIVREAAARISARLLPRTRAYAELWLDGAEVARVGPEVGSADGGEEPLYGPTYLPRKFKTAFAVAGDNSVDLFSNDLGFVPIFDGDVHLGWNVYVGGGLGRTHRKPETYPRLADALGFVGPDELEPIAEGVVRVYRDHGDRSNRRHARLKYLLEERGVDWFRARVEEATGIQIGPARPIDWHGSEDRLGWRETSPGRWFHGLRVVSGRVDDGDGGGGLRGALRAIAGLGVAFRVTPNQNLYLLDVPAARRPVVDAILADHGVAPAGSARGLLRLAMACPALPTCGLAVTEAERALPAVLDELQTIFDRAGVADAAPTIRMTGCPNGCARPYVAEIGLVGDAIDRYQIWLGGDGAGLRLATAVADRVHKLDLARALWPVVDRYGRERGPGERFGDFVVRIGIDRLEFEPTMPLRAGRAEDAS
ncbi:MAG TPA: NADPH-dependent assimilatory sulfite reductase hemoprotein subunit [Candidatus Limnocylindrales bacterium]